MEELEVRRYRCRHCNATLTVVPRGVIPRRHYSGVAIALALALYGLARKSLREVRARINPWSVVGATAAEGWTALMRWIRAIHRGELFAFVRASPPEWSARKQAERAATTLAALAPPGLGHLPLVEQAAAAGAQAAGDASRR